MAPAENSSPEAVEQITAAVQSVLLAPQPVYAGLFEPGAVQDAYETSWQVTDN